MVSATASGIDLVAGDVEAREQRQAAVGMADHPQVAGNPQPGDQDRRDQSAAGVVVDGHHALRPLPCRQVGEHPAEAQAVRLLVAGL